MLGYKAFIVKVYAKEDSPLGDLAREAKFNKDFPNRSDVKNEISCYLDYINASDKIKEAFEESWKAFAAYKKSVNHYE